MNDCSLADVLLLVASFSAKPALTPLETALATSTPVLKTRMPVSRSMIDEIEAEEVVEKKA